MGPTRTLRVVVKSRVLVLLPKPRASKLVNLSHSEKYTNIKYSNCTTKIWKIENRNLEKCGLDVGD